MNINETKQAVKQAFDAVRIMAEAIREAKAIPSGQLYAMAMDKMDLATYDKIISILCNSGLVTLTPHHLLVWNDPK